MTKQQLRYIRKVSSGFSRVTPLLCAALLTACSGGRYGDLESFIEEVKSQQSSRIDSMPEVEPYETFVYEKEGLRNPFIPYSSDPPSPVPGPRPGIRKAEPLEQFPLDALLFVGHLEKSGVRWGLVTAPDGSIYKVQVGNYMGKNHGKIVAISETQIKLIEIIPGGNNGGWIDRQAELPLSE